MFNIGVVGIGGMGVVHFNNYQHIENAKVTAICDLTKESQEFAALNQIKHYKSIDDMVCDKEINVIDICTPTFTHRSLALKAMKAKKHVICEKPIDLTYEGTKLLFDTAKKEGVMLFVGQVLQYTVESKILKELVKTGEYGKVLDAQFLRLSACPRWAKNSWFFDKEKSGFLPFDLHIHDLDLIISLFGEPKDISFTSCGNATKEYKEHYRFTYKWDDKNISAEAAWYNADIPFTATWRVYFENAVVINDGRSLIAYQFDKEPRIFDVEEKVKIPTGINLPPTGMFLEELSDFLSQIVPGKSGCPREKDILTLIKMLESINKIDA